MEADICSDEVIGIHASGNDTVFYKVVDNFIVDAPIYAKKMKCLKENNMLIYGSYSSAKGSHL